MRPKTIRENPWHPMKKPFEVAKILDLLRG
jgi:hypothetical protein